MKKTTRATVLFFACAAVSVAQQSVPLIVSAGVPLRLYLSKRIPKRLDAPVEAKLLTPLFAFDHEVIPAGSQVLGHVSRLQPVSKWDRFRAVMGGDFTPLHIAQVQFTSLSMPDGSQLGLNTAESSGLNSLVPLHPLKQKRSQSSGGGILGTARQNARDRIDAQIARIKSIPDIVRGPDKTEWFTDLLMSKLPYHPQYVRNRTRFDAELQEPLAFGSESISGESLAMLGSQPAAGSIAHARLLTPLTSRSSLAGQKIEAVLAEPLFSADHKLVLPEGTRVEGSVVLAKRAGWFHRGGRLRFNFQDIALPPQMAELKISGSEEKLTFRTQASLTAAESDKAPLKVDGEGGVQATESKTRFIGAAVAVLIARAAGDNDRDRDRLRGPDANVGGRTAGGGLGFGLLGSIAAQSSRNVGAALGYYGMAWTIYRTVIARGAEVQFDKNAVIDIGFNTRPVEAAAK